MVPILPPVSRACLPGSSSCLPARLLKAGFILWSIRIWLQTLTGIRARSIPLSVYLVFPQLLVLFYLHLIPRPLGWRGICTLVLYALCRAKRLWFLISISCHIEILIIYRFAVSRFYKPIEINENLNERVDGQYRSHSPLFSRNSVKSTFYLPLPSLVLGERQNGKLIYNQEV